MKELAEEDGVTWTMTHTYFANIGGFKFKVEGEPWLDSMAGSTSSRSTISLVSLERVYETIREQNSATTAAKSDEKYSQIEKDFGMSEKGGIVVGHRRDRSRSIHSSITGPQSVNEKDSIRGPQETPPTSVSSSEASTEHDASSVNTRRSDVSRNMEERTADEMFDPYYIYPNADQIIALRDWGMIDRLPQISAGEIAGMSCTSALGKTVTVLQISWFVLQIIARAAKHLPISQLEIATLAFVICATVIYLLFWSIPQGTVVSIEVNRDRPIHGHTLHPFASKLLGLGGYCGFDMHFWPGERVCPDPMFPPPNDVVRKDGPGWTKLNGTQQYPYCKIGIALAGTVFGVVHCLGWSFPFPTSAERILWRAASLYISLAFVPWPVSFVLASIFAREGLSYKMLRVMWWLTLIANVIYAVARAALLVLVSRCLFYLPAEAFVLTWADEIPHFS